MGFLQRLLGGKSRTFTFSSTIGSGTGIAPSVQVAGDWIVMRMYAPEIDPSTVKFDAHGGHLHVTGSGTKEGAEVKLEETISVAGGDESRAEVKKDGDDLVIRMPRG